MKVLVNRKKCKGCTICNITCPEVFLIEDDGKANLQVSEVPHEVEEVCEEAAMECPANAIMVEC